jgi:hypothetical protein
MTLRRVVSPTLVVAVVLLVYLGIVLSRAQGDPLTFAQIGDGFVDGAPQGRPGYDGQFSFWLALDPRPSAAATHFDVPAYRYQRILYPLVARLVALGQPALIPWALVLVNLLAQAAGTWLVESWLLAHGVNRWYAVSYGLWAGLVAAVRLDLAEPLCFALVAASFVAQLRGRYRIGAALLGLALFAKETALVFLAAQLLWAVVSRRRNLAIALVLAAVPFAVFQLWLLRWFGALGLASGGADATAFEWLPFMGLMRVADVSVPAFVLLSFILVPLIVAPAVWALAAALKRFWNREWEPVIVALVANALLMVVSPFSTFREPLGIIRLATGLVLATILYAGQVRSRRGLLLALLWLSGLAILVRE